MDALSEFFYMGGHYPYVWFCWGLTAVVLVWFVWAPLRRHQQLVRMIGERARRHGAGSTAGVADEPDT